MDTLLAFVGGLIIGWFSHLLAGNRDRKRETRDARKEIARVLPKVLTVNYIGDRFSLISEMKHLALSGNKKDREFLKTISEAADHGGEPLVEAVAAYQAFIDKYLTGQSTSENR